MQVPIAIEWGTVVASRVRNVIPVIFFLFGQNKWISGPMAGPGKG